MYGISRLLIATLAIVAMFAVILLYGANENARLESYAANFQGREIEMGADLYQQGCVQCHGANGEGLVGPALNAADLLVPEPGQTRSPRLLQKNYSGDLRSYIEGAVTYGRVGTVMPAWGQVAGGPFRPDQVHALATYIMNWSNDPGKKWGGAPDRVAVGGVEPEPVVVVAPLGTPPPRDVRSAVLGKYLFEGPAGCGSCHTFNGTTGKTGPELANVVKDKGRPYVKDSILNPSAALAAGHANLMPQTLGFSLSDTEVESIVDYLENPAAAGTTTEATGTTPAAGGGTPDGKALAQSAGCIACHSVDGSKLVGPSWKGLYNSEQEIEGDGKVTADDAYLQDSIVNPAAKIVKGYPNVMPATYGQSLKPDEIAAIIEYIKTLK
jgi:mono/diheme cytochrome c family protein